MTPEMTPDEVAARDVQIANLQNILNGSGDGGEVHFNFADASLLESAGLPPEVLKVGRTKTGCYIPVAHAKRALAELTGMPVSDAVVANSDALLEEAATRPVVSPPAPEAGAVTTGKKGK